ncbi:hypothetical protein F2Q69_00021124 [Brassica cretica]|uniref:Uncharacterized protein n=1 Tax=Brassica cretica TaxID=69181 RepID=A0A8S9Q305_BRACR|nr:hypothetical protein F2Q69_00021124 [Brassica cretica]
MRIEKRNQRRTFLRPYRSLRSDSRFDRSLRSEWKYAKKSPTCFRPTEDLTGRYVASGSKQRRVLLVFVVKSQRKLRLRRNEKRFDEDSKENSKEELSVALQRPSSVRARSLRSDRAMCVLMRSRSLRSDRAVCVLGLYVATEPCAFSCVLGRYEVTEQ